jgi:hypothetical protein
MLITVGYLSGKTALQRFAYFIFTFAIWDLFYYVFLYLLLGWPASIFTWDILFLIPVPWLGPVWAPCLLCGLMIVGAIKVISDTDNGKIIRIPKLHWALLIAGAVICIVSFMWEYLSFAREQQGYWSLISSKELFSEFSNYNPTGFNSGLFFFGFALMALPVFINYKKQTT